MTSLPPAGRGRQPDKDATRRIPASQLLRHLPFSGFNPDRGDHGDDVDDEPGDLDATPLAPRSDDCDYPEMPPECVGVAAPLPHADMTPTFPLVIRAPRGRQPVYPGYTPYAVVMSDPDDFGERDIISAVALVRQRCLNVEDAETVAVFNTHDQSEIRKVLPEATHIVVNDHNGWTLRTYPLD
jgi:hypothetical protein